MYLHCVACENNAQKQCKGKGEEEGREEGEEVEGVW